MSSAGAASRADRQARTAPAHVASRRRAPGYAEPAGSGRVSANRQAHMEAWAVAPSSTTTAAASGPGAEKRSAARRRESATPFTRYYAPPASRRAPGPERVAVEVRLEDILYVRSDAGAHGTESAHKCDAAGHGCVLVLRSCVREGEGPCYRYGQRAERCTRLPTCRTHPMPWSLPGRTFVGRSKQHVRIVTIRGPAGRPVPGDPILIASAVRTSTPCPDRSRRPRAASLTVSHSFYVSIINRMLPVGWRPG